MEWTHVIMGTTMTCRFKTHVIYLIIIVVLINVIGSIQDNREYLAKENMILNYEYMKVQKDSVFFKERYYTEQELNKELKENNEELMVYNNMLKEDIEKYLDRFNFSIIYPRLTNVTPKFPIPHKTHKKTYMSYAAITDTSSPQHHYKVNMKLNYNDALYYHKDYVEYVGVAMGSYFGPIGTFYNIVLDSGEVVKVVKVEHKANKHTINEAGVQHYKDSSVIEFMVNVEVGHKIYSNNNGLVNNGNFNKGRFKGNIVEIYRVEW